MQQQLAVVRSQRDIAAMDAEARIAALAEERAAALREAEAVMQALIDRGVDPDWLSTEGYGADRPVADNTTDRGRRENRRVEVVMIGDAGGAANSLSDN